MRSIGLTSALFVFALIPGCSLMSGSTDLNASTPGLEGPADPGDDPDSEWNSIGREARSGQFAEYDSDGRWFDNLASPRAQSIERSLGVFR